MTCSNTVTVEILFFKHLIRNTLYMKTCPAELDSVSYIPRIVLCPGQSDQVYTVSSTVCSVFA